MDYEVAMGNSGESLHVHHDDMAEATKGPLAPRLDRLIRQVSLDELDEYGACLVLFFTAGDV